MHYKTIILSLLEQQPILHEQLRRQRKLLSTMNRLALELKTDHEQRQAELSRSRPDSDPLQRRSEALELEVQELEHRIASISTEDNHDEACSLDDAMNFLRRHTPTT